MEGATITITLVGDEEKLEELKELVDDFEGAKWNDARTFP